MVEFAAMDQNKAKRMIRSKESLRDLCQAVSVHFSSVQLLSHVWLFATPLNAPKFALKGSQKEKRERERNWESVWRDSSQKLPQHEKLNSHPCPQSTESPRKDKPKEEQARHIAIKVTKIKDEEKTLKAMYNV